MRLLLAFTLTAAIAAGTTGTSVNRVSAGDKTTTGDKIAPVDKDGIIVEWAGLKSAVPAGWKEETPSNNMRLAQFKLPKAEGDPEDAELAVFGLPGGGSIQDNLARQEKKFEIPAGKKPEDAIKTEKTKVGTNEAMYMDIQGTFLKKFPPNDPNAKITKVADYRELYVVFEAKKGDSTVLYSMTLLGPAKTIEKHKKAFDEWVKNFK